MSKLSSVFPAQAIRVWLGFFVRAMLIGLADLFPGVSGGTIALLTGVYLRFIEALASLRPALLLFLRGRLRESLQRIDWVFFTALVCGASLSIAVFSKLVSWLLAHQALPTFSLFSGLVLYTGFSLARTLPLQARYLVVGIAGLALAFFLRELASLFILDSGNIPLPLFAIGGAIAIAAMILPGISGSMLLLVLGMYRPVVDALAHANLPVLAVFIGGVCVGLLLFAPMLRYSYHNYQQPTVAFLAGLTFGAVRETMPLDIQSDSTTLLTVLLFVGVGVITGRGMDYVAKKYS